MSAADEERMPAAASIAAEPLLLRPIGVVRSALGTRVEAARQPAAAPDEAARIELHAGHHFEHALEDLAGWEYIWVLFWFHLNSGWRPKVLPPRSNSGRKGVFATRAPHRPNPLGLSAVRLERVEGLVLHIRGGDMLDGTPVLDIKPYVPYTDAHPQAGSGWLAETAVAPADPLPAWTVGFTPLAEEQLAWVEQHAGLALRERITATLMLGPQPHPYRRIRRQGDGLVLAVKAWRIHGSVEGHHVEVRRLATGYRPAELRAPGAAEGVRAIHRAFLARWPDGEA